MHRSIPLFGGMSPEQISFHTILSFLCPSVPSETLIQFASIRHHLRQYINLEKSYRVRRKHTSIPLLQHRLPLAFRIISTATARCSPLSSFSTPSPHPFQPIHIIATDRNISVLLRSSPYPTSPPLIQYAIPPHPSSLTLLIPFAIHHRLPLRTSTSKHRRKYQSLRN